MELKNLKYCSGDDTFYDVTTRNEYCITTLKDGIEVLHCIGCCTLTHLEELTEEQQDRLKDIYEADVTYCSDCGAAFDSDDYYYPDTCEFRYLDCDVKCLECITSDDLLVEVTAPKDIFKAQNMVDVDVELEEVAELFIDSSGWGHSGERALTIKESEIEVARLLKEHEGSELVCGLTGIGQFQVYVTIWKRG